MGKANAGKWINAIEAGRICDVTPATIHNWRKDGVFKRLDVRLSPRRPGRKRHKRYRFSLVEVKRVAKNLVAA